MPRIGTTASGVAVMATRSAWRLLRVSPRDVEPKARPMLRLMFAGLYRHWPEQTLGAVAIGVVVAALLAQQAVADSAEKSVHDLAHRMGRNMIVLPQRLDAGDFHRLRFNDAVLPAGAADTIRRSHLSEHIKLVEPRLYGNVNVAGHEVVVVGTLDIPASGPKAPAPVVLGVEAARRLGVEIEARLDVNGIALQVARIDPAPPEGLDLAIFTSLASAQQILKRPGGTNVLRLGGCWCRLDVPTLARQVEAQLPGTRSLTVAGMLNAQKGTVATMKRYSSALLATGLALVAAIITALIASQVRRQMREIGLLLAIGVAPGFASLTFVVRALVVAFSGAVIGLVLANPATHLLSMHLLEVPVGVSAASVPLVLVLSLGVAGLAAAVLAIRATRLDPTQILREP